MLIDWLEQMAKTMQDETDYKHAMPHLGYTITIGSDIVIFDEELIFTPNPNQRINKQLPFKPGTFFEAVELNDGRAALKRVEIKNGQYRRINK